MKKNLILLAVTAMTALLAFTSCNDDKAQSVIPHISGMTVTPTSTVAGTQCMITLTFDRQGEYIQGHYKYTISKSGETIATGEFLATPTSSTKAYFTAPADAGTYSISVKCTKVETYAGSSLYYMGSMDDIGSAHAEFTVEAGLSIPHISGLTITPTSAEPDALCTATLTFDQQGENINGHYEYTISKGSNIIATGDFQATPTPSTDITFNAPHDEGLYTMRVKCTAVETFVGDNLYYTGSLDEIGSATKSFNVVNVE